MRALLLAAGRGERLRPLTDATPKCLVEIGGKPLIDYWLDAIFDAGVERALVNTGYRASQVDVHLAKSQWRDRVDTTFEPVLLGTGGTIIANRAFFAREPFLVVHADNLSDLDIRQLIDAHAARAPDAAITMAAFQTDRPRDSGILELDQRNVVTAFHEKVADPPGDLANAAVYVFEPEVIDAIASLGRPVVDLSTEIIPRYLGRIQAYIHRGYHRDIGTLGSLVQALAEFPAGR